MTNTYLHALRAAAPYVESVGQALFRLRVPIMFAAGLAVGVANAEAADGSSGEDLGNVVEKVWKVIEARLVLDGTACELTVHNTHDGTPTDTMVLFDQEHVGPEGVEQACKYKPGDSVEVEAHEVQSETATQPGTYVGKSIKPYKAPQTDLNDLFGVAGTLGAVGGILCLLDRRWRKGSTPP